MRATGILLLGVLLAQPTSPLGRTHRMAESVVASTSVPGHAAAPRSGRVAKSEKETPRAPGPLPCGLRGLRGLRGGDSDAARTGGHECPGCGQAAVRRVVNKAGANKGRSFFCCARPSSAACRALFKWADAPGARAPSSAAALPRQVSPNITVVTRITAPTGQVTLRDSAGKLLAMSPHPRSLVPPPPSTSPSPLPASTGPANATKTPALAAAVPDGNTARQLSPADQPCLTGEAGPAGASQQRGLFEGFRTGAGTPLRVPDLQRAPLVSPPAAATIAGTGRMDSLAFGRAGAAPGELWGGTEVWGTQSMAPICALSGGYKRDPRTEPTVGGKGGGVEELGGHGQMPGAGFWRGAQSATLPGWPIRAAYTQQKRGSAFKPPRPAQADDALPQHPLLTPSKTKLAPPAAWPLQAAAVVDQGAAGADGGRQTRHGPILCGNGSTGEFRVTDFARATTGPAQATLQMVGAKWQLVSKVHAVRVCVCLCVSVCVCVRARARVCMCVTHTVVYRLSATYGAMVALRSCASKLQRWRWTTAVLAAAGMLRAGPQTAWWPCVTPRARSKTVLSSGVLM